MPPRPKAVVKVAAAAVKKVRFGRSRSLACRKGRPRADLLDKQNFRAAKSERKRVNARLTSRSIKDALESCLSSRSAASRPV